MHKLSITFASRCLAGGKNSNEDACGVRIPDDSLLSTKGIAAVIADGMSGSDAGSEASQTCVEGFLSDYFSTPESWEVKTSAHKILSALNHWLHGRGQKNFHSHKGMVSTLSAIVLKSNTAYIFHVGDSRIYRYRQGELQLLTNDHRIQVSDEKSLLTRAMGIDLMLDIDFRKLDLEKNDLLIMLTDGVHDFVSDRKLIELIHAHSDNLDALSDNIVNKALNNKSDDNTTCLLLKIDDLPGENKEEFYQKLTELPFPPPLSAGMILDGYKILRHLFSNKRTEVYLAQDSETEDKVILKAPSVNYEDDPDYINRFLHEEWVGRRINSPHVMKVLKSNRKRTALYYLSEYISGRTLRQWMEDESSPSITVVRDIISQIAKGLRAFHRLEMIHQDLKPENILIDEHGTVKIIDFGSTRISGIEEITSPITENNLLGTINYSAPEYHVGSKGSNRSDIFSLGIIAYELLTGKRPYGKDLSARNIRRVSYLSTRNFRPDIPRWVDKAIEKAVQINPELRYSLLSEFVHALSQPDQALLKNEFVPLIKRNPQKVWPYISFLLFVLNLILLYLLYMK